jgi:hypothetical protein
MSNRWTRLADKNLALVREYYRTHLGTTAKNAARALGMNHTTVYKYVRILRSEWRTKCASQASTSKHTAPTQLSLFNLLEQDKVQPGSQQPCSKPTDSAA